MDLVSSVKEIISKMPYWFDVRHEGNRNNTYTILSIFGETIYKLNQCIEQAYNLTNLDTFDNQDYVVRKIVFDEIIDISTVKVNKLIAVSVDNEHLLLNNKNENILHKYIKSVKYEDKIVKYSKDNTYYFYDSDRSILYISGAKYNDNIYVNNKKYSHTEHRVWNADLLDEFGLIYSMPRIPGENNKDYKDRLLEYSVVVSNSTFHGISNAIGHSLNTYHIIDWNNGGEAISISSNDKICRHVFVDDKPYHDVYKITDNTISLNADNDYYGISRKIKYFTGFDMYNLDSIDINNDEYKHLFYKISKMCPIMWGIARWGDVEYLDNNVDSYYYMAPTFDPDLSKLQR